MGRERQYQLERELRREQDRNYEQQQSFSRKEEYYQRELRKSVSKENFDAAVQVQEKLKDSLIVAACTAENSIIDFQVFYDVSTDTFHGVCKLNRREIHVKVPAFHLIQMTRDVNDMVDKILDNVQKQIIEQISHELARVISVNFFTKLQK